MAAASPLFLPIPAGTRLQKLASRSNCPPRLRGLVLAQRFLSLRFAVSELEDVPGWSDEEWRLAGDMLEAGWRQSWPELVAVISAT